ncbi:MAG: EF-P lysine aminoacylase EpmA [Proteobacteria bacterium]|nr:EF-P lysine aminoacylase EpmA [Pseudomonadota bacterium]
MSVPGWHHLKARARALRGVRDFFDARGFVEIETRYLRRTTATDPYIESFSTSCCDGERYYLQTSPEYAHKILLSEHRHPVYEVARVFRNEPHGALHRREFTLIEWYHPEYDEAMMMDETEALIRAVACSLGVSSLGSSAREKSEQCTLGLPFERLTVDDAFMRYAGFSPLGMSQEMLVAAARRTGSRVGSDWSWNDVFNCVLVDHIEPRLGMGVPTFLVDYPTSMASLAQVRHAHTPLAVAERFELYVCGIELCNGYAELDDAQVLRRRFAEDNAERLSMGLEVLPEDEMLLAALPQLGKLSGNALGFDRLLMLCLGCDDISEVVIEV